MADAAETNGDLLARAVRTLAKMSPTQLQAMRTGRIYLEATRARMHALGVIGSSQLRPLERPAYWIFSLTPLGREVERLRSEQEVARG